MCVSKQQCKVTATGKRNVAICPRLSPFGTIWLYLSPFFTISLLKYLIL